MDGFRTYLMRNQENDYLQEGVLIVGEFHPLAESYQLLA
jgi:hypothetical protein